MKKINTREERLKKFAEEAYQHVQVSLMNNRTKDDYSDEAVRNLVDETVLHLAIHSDDNLRVDEMEEISRNLFFRIRGELGILEPYLLDESVTEIMVNGKDEIFLETEDGVVPCDESFVSTEELEECIRKIAAAVHREINETNPILDARLTDGSRVNAVYRNVALDGPALTIRKFRKNRMTAEDLVETGTMTKDCADILGLLIECGYNLFISGGTSTGKTTFLNAMSDYLHSDERVIVIEDSRELMMEQIPNIVQMECRQANSSGKGRISMEELIRTSLRMRPDRIIVGEVRGAEAALMLQALNTGHSGLSTGHGNSVNGMLRRLEAMCLMNANVPIDSIRCQIVEALDIMVHLVRLPDGRRVVSEICELTGYEDGSYCLNPLFLYDGHAQVKLSNSLEKRHKLKERGFGDVVLI
ncbi:MAG: CpaF family protein [Eubacterium sp.]